MYLGSAGLSPAQAADLGGDCCADLEERVAELEATTARKGNRRVSLTISGQVSTAVMAWDAGARADTPATPDTVAAKGGVPVVVPGKAQALNNAGSSSDVYIVDNVMSGGSFFQLAGNARINPNVTAGFQLTMAFCAGSRSHHVNQLDDDANVATCFPGGGGDVSTVVTLANWYLDHKSLGRVTVGRINTATAGITTIDLGGAGVIANASIGYTQRGFILVTEDPGIPNAVSATWSAILGGNAVNGASLSRANAISYTSPTLGGFSVAAAWGEDDVWDVALRYAGEFGGFRVAAGIGYIYNQSGLTEFTKDHAVGPEPTQWKGSASILHVASGLFLTGAYLRQDNDGLSSVGTTEALEDTTLWYVQGGISKNWTGLGNTVLYGEYARVEDGVTCAAGANSCAVALGGNAGDIITSSRADMWGIGVVQHIDAAAMELFLSYKRFSAEFTSPVGNDLNGTLNFNDFDVVMGGARIRF